jgi:hypothetical protein
VRSTKSSDFSRVCRLGLFIGFLFTALWLAPTRALADIPLQDQCSPSYDETKSYCTPVVKTEWLYSIVPHGSSQLLGTFKSESAAIAAATAVSWPALLQPSGWCSFAYSHVEYDVYPIVSDYGSISVTAIWFGMT